MARSRRLVRGCERLSETLVGLHDVAFGLLMLDKAEPLFAWNSRHNPTNGQTPVKWAASPRFPGRAIRH